MHKMRLRIYSLLSVVIPPEIEEAPSKRDYYPLTCILLLILLPLGGEVLTQYRDL